MLWSDWQDEFVLGSSGYNAALPTAKPMSFAAAAKEACEREWRRGYRAGRAGDAYALEVHEWAVSNGGHHYGAARRLTAWRAGWDAGVSKSPQRCDQACPGCGLAR